MDPSELHDEGRDEAARLRAQVAELESRCARLREELDGGRRVAAARDRSDVEQSLEQTREQLQLALEAAQLGTLDWNLVTGELAANDRLAQMLGYSTEELGRLMSNWEAMAHPEDLPEMKRAMESSFRGETPVAEFEYRTCTGSGQWRWMLARGKVIQRDERGTPLRALGIVMDIHERKQDEEALRAAHRELEDRVSRRTAELAAANAALAQEIEDRKQAEQSLLESEQMARALMNAATEAAILVDLDSTIVTLNETAANRLGGTVEQLVGRRCFDLLPPELAASRRERGAEVVRTGRAVRFEDQRDGRLTDTNVYPVFDKSGQVVRLAIFNRDITEIRIVEEKVRREQALLHQLLEIQERERQLVAYEIHDGLAQELTGAMFRFQGFRTLLETDPGEAWKTFQLGLDLLAKAVQEARSLITGLRPPILDESDIATAVEYLICENEDRGGPSVEFQHNVQHDRLAPSLRVAVFRIIQESLTNARRHSGSSRVRLELLAHDECVEIDVRDWGVGFDAAQITAQHFGLEGIRQRVRLLGGRMTLESRTGEGTRLHVELPLVEQPAGSS